MAFPSPTRDQMLRWIDQWRSAEVALARLRAEELLEVDLARIAVQLDDACRAAIERDPPGNWSGLVEQQRRFHGR